MATVVRAAPHRGAALPWRRGRRLALHQGQRAGFGHGWGGSDGEEDADRGALAEGARDGEGAAVGLDDVLDDGEAEAGAAELARACLVDAEEALRETRQVLGGNADAAVLDRDLDHPRMLRAGGREGPHQHGPARRP